MVARRGLGRGLGHLIPQEPKNQTTAAQTPSPVLAPAGVLPESALREVPVRRSRGLFNLTKVEYLWR